MDKAMKEKIANWLEIYERLHDEGEELDGTELEKLCMVVNGAYDILFDLNKKYDDQMRVAKFLHEWDGTKEEGEGDGE